VCVCVCVCVCVLGGATTASATSLSPADCLPLSCRLSSSSTSPRFCLPSSSSSSPSSSSLRLSLRGSGLEPFARLSSGSPSEPERTSPARPRRMAAGRWGPGGSERRRERERKTTLMAQSSQTLRRDACQLKSVTNRQLT